jgi:hypothetical protein
MASNLDKKNILSLQSLPVILIYLATSGTQQTHPTQKQLQPNPIQS